jgi:PIN domain nuclease of toxin-antitoxin system
LASRHHVHGEDITSRRSPRSARCAGPAHHRDPFDRLLVAQSLVEDLTLPTADAQLARYGRSVRVV